MKYGYARVSTQNQNIDRQIRNIQEECKDAMIFQDKYTGTKMDRPQFQKLLSIVKPGDTIIFDSVSRMSRNAEDGKNLYNDLLSRGIELEFIKEPHINTRTYKDAISNQRQIELTGDITDCIIRGINEFMFQLSARQIELAFDGAESEVEELRRRTREGMLTAKLNGKQIGAVKGKKLDTKKSKDAKEIILKHSKQFGGTLSNEECWTLCGITKNSFYKYTRELKEESLDEEVTLVNIDSLFQD